MPVPASVATNDTVQAIDVNQYKQLLEGGSSYTTTYVMVSTTGTNFVVRLGDAAGANKLSIQNSASVEKAYIDSNGAISGSITIPSGGVLVAPLSAAPAQTAKGSIVYDSVLNQTSIGNGTGRDIVVAGTPAIALAGSSSAATSTTSTSAVDLVTVTVSIPATTAFRVEFNWRKQALAANGVSFGLKTNTTIIQDCAFAASVLARSTATNQAEDGICILGVSPRTTGYLNGMYRFYQTRQSSTGSAQDSGTLGSENVANFPTATITSIIIRAQNHTASNAAEVTSVRVLTGIS